MKKGFTLIELLAVIIILGLIGLIVIPSITKLIRESRENLYTNQVRMIEESARKWGIANTDILSETENNYLSLSDLINAGFIEQDEVKDPRDSKTKMKGCIIITYNNQKSKYVYKYSDDECSAGNLLVSKFLSNNPGFGEYTLLYGENYFVGEDPNNWLLFGNNLWRVLKDSDEGIKIIFERSCTGTSIETCNGGEDGTIYDVTNMIYYDLDYNINTNKWNNEPNYFQEALDYWYDEIGLNESYIEPINWCLGATYDIYGFSDIRNSECEALSDTISNSGDYDATTNDISPIGLFTLTDIIIASDSIVSSFDNYSESPIKVSYLNKDYDFLTMTANADTPYDPIEYWGIRSYNSYGSWDISPERFNYWAEIRPVVNLRANTIYKGGEGTENDPYIIE